MADNNCTLNLSCTGSVWNIKSMVRIRSMTGFDDLVISNINLESQDPQTYSLIRLSPMYPGCVLQ